MPEDPFREPRRATAFGIGMIHGVGAETPTQILVFLTAAGAGRCGAGVVVLVCFIAGLVTANTAVALAAAGLLRASGAGVLHIALSIVIAALSLVVGAGGGGRRRCTADQTSAHPLGNFTTNVYAGLIVGPDTLSVDYVLDLAEIPALPARAAPADNGDDQISDRESSDWAAKECGLLAPMVDVRVEGASPLLGVGRSSLAFPPGQAGISTLRLECRLETPLEWGLRLGSRISLIDRTFADRIGWQEVTAIGDGATLSRSDAPSRSISGRLTRYPRDELSSPREQRTATVVARPGGARDGGGARRAGRGARRQRSRGRAYGPRQRPTDHAPVRRRRASRGDRSRRHAHHCTGPREDRDRRLPRRPAWRPQPGTRPCAHCVPSGLPCPPVLARKPPLTWTCPARSEGIEPPTF